MILWMLVSLIHTCSDKTLALWLWCVYRARQEFRAKTDGVQQAHAKVQQLLDTATSQAFIADAPGAENVLDQQFCITSQPW